MTLTTKDCNFTAIDFETANWYRKSACSIGLVKVENGEIVDEFYSLIKPTPYEFNPINVRIHGINHTMCSDAPSFQELWPRINKFINGQLLIAHNVSFEKSVLHHLFNHCSIDAKVKDYLCTYYMSRVYLHQLKSHKLNHICNDLFGKTINHHNALEDAKACAEIAMHIINKIQPPNFERMVAALYEKPIEERTSRKETPLAQLEKDPGFEDNLLFKGTNYSFTGELEGFTREEAGQFVVNRGGKAGDNVTKVTTHLVIGGYDPQYGEQHKSQKLKRAVELNSKGAGIIIMSGQDFIELTNENLNELATLDFKEETVFNRVAF